jgi:hypothetical protein
MKQGFTIDPSDVQLEKIIAHGLTGEVSVGKWKGCTVGIKVCSQFIDY